MACYSLKDKVVVITGAAKGIGRAIAENFLQKGIKTAILLDFNEVGSKTAETLNSKFGSKKAVFIKCDITKDLETISKVIFDSYQTVDVLINNAGIIDEASIKRTMDTNAVAVMEWSLKFLGHMKNHCGTIINIASTSVFNDDNFVPIYKASKFAVIGFSRTLGHSNNYHRTGVRVLVICPGVTDTKFCNTNVGEEMQADWDAHVRDAAIQTPEAVGSAVAEVFERADSGTVWQIIGDRPLVEVFKYH